MWVFCYLVEGFLKIVVCGNNRVCVSVWRKSLENFKVFFSFFSSEF